MKKNSLCVPYDSELVVEVSLALFINDMFLPASWTGAMSLTELRTALIQVMISGSSSNYKTAISSASGFIWPFLDLGALTFSTEITANYYAKLVATIKASLLALNSGKPPNYSIKIYDPVPNP